ncbi:MAG: orotidine-5-phosphate decarboxylase [Bacteroidota bacterium]|jgi:orotidine-5'-phosphate decarboxylase
MQKTDLIQQIKAKKSFLCIGLDTDITKIPAHLLAQPDPIFAFNKEIIDVTADLCVAYKPNLAFYESMGAAGWESLRKTMEYIPSHCFTIADAKRGDIGNTSSMYAKTFFDPSAAGFNFDSVTVAPYMGSDSVTPFFAYENKWVILLALTSNEGAKDFQFDAFENGEKVFERVLTKSSQWGTDQNMMYVVGATRGEAFAAIRKLVPEHFLLVPGVGAQGGSLADVCKYGINKDCGLLVNSSRAIIYASNTIDFANQARAAALLVQQEMEEILISNGII